jgi:hypothetical protein
MMDVVEEDEDGDGDARYMELFVSFASPEAVAGEEESRYYTLKWLSPPHLLDIARDLVACDERGGDAEAVMRAWFELWGGPLGDYTA